MLITDVVFNEDLVLGNELQTLILILVGFIHIEFHLVWLCVNLVLGLHFIDETFVTKTTCQNYFIMQVNTCSYST